MAALLQFTGLTFLVAYAVATNCRVFGYWFLLPLTITTWEVHGGNRDVDLRILDKSLAYWWMFVNTYWYIITEGWTNIPLTVCGLYAIVWRAMDPLRKSTWAHALAHVVSASVGTCLLALHVNSTFRLTG